jgi:hypothetical protein
MRENVRVRTLASIAVTAAALVGASLAAASSAVVTCGSHHGFVVYTQNVGCPTAKRTLTKIEKLPYKGGKAVPGVSPPSVTAIVRSLPGWVCAVTYNKKTKKVRSGSCLKKGTRASGFGFTRGGAPVPLPPGVSPGTTGASGPTGSTGSGSGGIGY